MKFVIENLQGPTTVKTKYGLKQKYRFTSKGQQYDAWVKKGYTDAFKVGHSFEAELSGKPYQGIDTIQWPKQESFGGQGFMPNQTQVLEAIKSQVERIERKLDKLLTPERTWEFVTPTNNHRPTTIETGSESGKSLNSITGQSPNVGYAEEIPPPTDEDAPF